MQIKQELPQFTDKKALFIVSGKQSAKFYLAESGQIDELAEISLPSPESQYTDREGYFERKAPGDQTIGSGSVYEPKKDYLVEKFTNELSAKALELDKAKQPDETYIFAPGYMKNKIRDDLSEQVRKKIAGEFEGNFVENHPFDILKKIKKEREAVGPVTPRSQEADKLINKEDYK